MGYGLGVDIGTTWTAAAIARAGSEPQVLSLGGRTAAVPTVVHVLPDRSANVGDAAERRAVTDPDRVAREFKRRLGDTTPVLLGGEPWSPESLMATVLRWVIGRATELEGEPPERIVVTHPANWGPLRKELIEQAIAHTGVAATFVTEPEAAAAHYAAATRVPEGAVVAVYDLGGGTFDATVLRKTAGGFDVLGKPEGVERLGGLDFDAAVLGHVTGMVGIAWSSLDPNDPAIASSVLRLRRDCVLAKEALSEDADATIPVTLPTVATEVRLTRAELESMIRTPIEQSVDALARAIAAAGLTPAQVDRILLVGGSSRIPLVSQALVSRFDRPLALDTHPKHAVALGAARLALAAITPTWTAPPTSPPPTSPPPTTPPPGATPSPPPTPLPPTPAPVGRSIPLWIPAAAVVVVVAIVAALVLVGGGGDGDEDDDAVRFDRDSAESDDEGSSNSTAARDDDDILVRVTLRWSANADLDLTIVEPDGTAIDPLIDGPSPSGGVHSGDAGIGCDEGGGFEEVVWTVDSPPPSGEYDIDVTGFGVDSDGCGSGDFSLSIEIDGQETRLIEESVTADGSYADGFSIP